jgi:uncharacterized protein YxeA
MKKIVLTVTRILAIAAVYGAIVAIKRATSTDNGEEAENNRDRRIPTGRHTIVRKRANQTLLTE